MKRPLLILLPLLLLLGAGYFFFSKTSPSTHPATVSSTQEKKKRPKTALPSRVTPNQQGAPEEFEDDPKGSLRLDGQVVDEAGKGVEGALVVVNSNPRQQKLSGPNGWFGFDGMLARTYQLEARKGGASGEASAIVRADSTPVTLTLQTGSTLIVTVLDALDRHPIADANVSIGRMSKYETTTDAQGKATLVGLGSWEVVEVEAQGYGPYRDLVNASQDSSAKQERTITLSPGALVSGVVLDPSGAPAAGARITVETSSAWGVGLSDDDDKIVADEQGRWQIKALSAGSYRFRARHEKFAPGLSAPTSLDGRAPKEDVEIRLTEGASLSGRVVASDGSPVPSALISIGKSSIDMLNTEPNRKAYSDESGAFLVEGLPRASLLAVASTNESYSDTAEIDLSGSATKDITLRLMQDGTISGVVLTTKGAPVADAEVFAFPRDFATDQSRWRVRGVPRAVSDIDGLFTLQGVPEGAEFLLSASTGSLRGSSPWSDEESTKAKAGDQDVKIVLKDLGGIKGKVLFADGSAPESYEVSAGWESRASFGSPDGSFELKKVPPGKVKVTVTGPKLLETSSEIVEVRAAEVIDVGTITVVAGRLIRGRVLSQKGAPVAGATVYAANMLLADGNKISEFPGLPMKKEVTKEDGSFEIGGLISEEFYVVADHASEGRSATIKVPPGKEDVTLELSLLATGSLSGEVTYKGAPVSAMLSVVPKDVRRSITQGKSEADGLFRFDKLSVGTYLLTASRLSTAAGPFSQGGSKTLEVTVKSGEAANYEVEILSGVTVVIRPTLGGVAIKNVAAQLLKGTITATSTKQLEAITNGLNPDALHSGVVMDIPMMPAEFITIEDVLPESYTLCLSRTPSFAELQAGGVDMMQDRPLLCAPLKVAPSPEKQEFSSEAPAE